MSSQTYLVFCLIVCMFCIFVVTNLPCVLLIVCMFCFCVVTNVPCVLFKCSHVLHLRRHKRTLSSVEMFARFAFVSSQSYCGFCVNICMLCTCVVANVPCVLFDCLYNLHLCCHKRTLCSVEMLARFAFVSSQTYLVFCLIVRMFCICAITNVPCVLFNCLHNLHLCCHKCTLGSVEMFACFAFVS